MMEKLEAGSFLPSRWRISQVSTRDFAGCTDTSTSCRIELQMMYLEILVLG